MMKAYQRRRLEKLQRNRHKRTRQGLTYEQWCQKGRDIYLSVHQNRKNAWFQQQQKKKRSSSAMTLPQQQQQQKEYDRPAKRARMQQQQQQQQRGRQQDETTAAAAPTNAIAAVVAARDNHDNDDDKNNNSNSNSLRRFLGDDFDRVFDSRNHHQASMTKHASQKKQAAAKREESPSPSTNDEIEKCEEEDDFIILDDDDDDDGAGKEQKKLNDMNEQQQTVATTTKKKKDAIAATTLPSADTLKSLQENPSAGTVTQEESSSTQVSREQQKRLSQQQHPPPLVDVKKANNSFVDTIFPPSKKRHRTTFARSNRLQHQDSNKTAHSSDNNTGKGTQPRLQDEEASSFLTFDVASSKSNTPQFWALVEGIVVYDTSSSSSSARQASFNSTTSVSLATTAAASYWQDLWMDRRVDLLPTTGRVLELLPLESKSGRWQASVVRLVHTTMATASAGCGSNSKTKTVPCRLGLLRESEQDWRNKRVILRHASIPQTTFNYLCTKGVPAGYTVSVIDPSLHRSAALQQQGVLPGAANNKKKNARSLMLHKKDRIPLAWSVASLSLVAFEGFSSVAESERHAPILAKTVLQACSEDSFWSKRNHQQQKPQQLRSVMPPDLMKIPAFGDASSNIWKAATIVQGSGGISLLGNIVDAVRGLDYQILVLREEATNQIVGLDVVFCSEGSTNSSPSLTDTSLSVIHSQSPTFPLTTQNLELHNEKKASYLRPSYQAPYSAREDVKSSLVEELVEHEPSAKRLKTSLKSPDPALSSRSADSQDGKVMSGDDEVDLFVDVQADEPLDSQPPIRNDPPNKEIPLPKVPVTGSHNNNNNNDKKTCPATMPSTTTTTSKQFELAVTSSNAEKTEVRKPAEGLPRITPTPAAATTSTLEETKEPGGMAKVPRRLFTENQTLEHAANFESLTSLDYYHAHEKDREETIVAKEVFDENTSEYYDALEDGEVFDADTSSTIVCFHDMMYGGLKNDLLEASRDELLALSISPRASSKFALVNLMQQCSDILYDEDGDSKVAQVSTWIWLYHWIMSGLLLALFSPALLYLLRLLHGPHSLCFGTTPIVFDDESYFPDVAVYRLESFFTGEDVSFVFLLFAGKVIGRDYRYPTEYTNETRPSM